ncbi:MAG: PKD domain-containing protein [Bacteroidota bacterium]
MRCRFFIILSIIISSNLYSQCGPGVPAFNVDLTGVPDSIWTSPSVLREDNCCGTIAPDKCVKFVITLDPDAEAINFNIIAGAVPGGALFYQINCGPETALGQPICLNGVGPHVLTFCKPGNNDNVYQISSIPKPVGGADVTINDGCIGQLTAVGFNAASANWTSVYPGAAGAYNSYLSCTSGCLNPTVTGQGGAPPYIDYVVCGLPDALCNSITVCDTLRVVFNTTLIATIIPQNPTICFGQTSTTVTVNGSGGSPPYTYLWNTGSTSQTINVGVGTYSVLLKDASDCPPTSALVTVTSFSVAITANAGADITVCSESPIATLNGSVAGASGGTWAGGAGVFSPNNTTLSGATYAPTTAEILNGFVNLYLTTTGNGTCLPDIDSVVINFSNFNASVSTVITNVSCFGGNDGSAAIAITGGPNPFTYFWNTVPAQSSATAINLAQGTYSVAIQDGVGCSYQTSVTITQPLPLTNNSLVTNVSCAGGSNGSIAITPMGGTSPYTYLWQPGNQTTSSIIGQPAGSYTVTITDAEGCQISSTNTIIQPLALAISFTSTNVSCFNGNNGSVTSSISGGTSPYSYSWNPIGATTPNIISLQAGSYTLTLTDDNGCITSSTTSITQPTLLSSSISSIDETCDYLNNGSATAFAAGGTPGYTYLWQPGGQTSGTASNLSSGTYTLTTTDLNSCIATSIVTINQPTPLTVSFINQVNVTCFSGNNGGITASATGGNPNYTYSWMPGSLNSASISNLLAGTYSVTVTDNYGCQVQNNVTITQPFFPLAVSVSSTPASCNGGSNGSVSSSASGGSGPYSYNWMPGNYNGQNVLNIPGGNYTITVTDSKGCIVTNSVIVSQPSQMVLTPSTVNSSCSLPNGQASVSVAGGIGTYTYLWSPSGGTNSTATGLMSGTYLVFVSDANNCTASKYINVNDNTGPSVSIFSSSNVSCNGGSDGSATVGVSSGSGPFTYSWAPSGGTNATANGLTAGTYTVTVIDAIGCQSLATTSPAITEPSAISVTLSTANVGCFGGSNGTATASATGGTGTFSYQWLPMGTMGSTISTLSATTYTLQVTDANSCIESQTFTIGQPTVLLASISSFTNVSCFNGNNGTATVNVSGGMPFYNYNWLPGGGNGSTGTGLAVGTYTVNITDSKGCTTSTSQTISQPSQALSATSTPVATNCFGGADGSATINPVGGTGTYSYQWSPSGGTGQIATGLTAGNYFVLVTDGNGCATNILLAVSQPSQISGTLLSSNPSCGLSNGSISSQIGGGIGPYSYLWIPGSSTNSTLSNVGPGSYTLQVTDSKNCIQSFLINLTNIPGPSVAVSSVTDVSCYGGNNGTVTINISQGTAPFYTSWSPYGGNNLSASSLTAGTYTANVTDALGCTASATGTINQPTALIISASAQSNVSCYGGNNGSITIASAGGTPTYNYSWFPVVSSSPTVNNLTAGTYSVTVTDQQNCPASISINITQPALLSASVGSSVNTTCYNGSDGSATAIATGGTLPYSYFWSTTPDQITSTATNLSSGTGSGITYTVTITDGQGCIKTNTVLITHPTQVITVASPNDSICLGQSGTVTASASGGAGNYYYSWLPVNTVNSGSLTTTPSTSTSYTVIATDQNGCAGTPDTVSVVPYILGPANVQAIGFSPICPGQSSVVYVETTGATGQLTYSWNNNLGAGPGGYLVTPAQPTTYIVTVSNNCGASVTDSVSILFNPPPTLSLTSDTDSTCVPKTIQFFDNSITGNINDPISAWYWNFGDGTSSSLPDPTHNYTLPGTFTVTLTVTTTNGCTSNNTSAPFIINAYPYPIAAFSVNSTLLDIPYDLLVCTNQSTNATLFNWSFGDGGTSFAENPQHLYNSVGIFQVQFIATSPYGCADTAYSTITTNADVIFPNVFTPNPVGGPGGTYDMNTLDNDIFFPYTTGVDEFKLEIFNRWGEQIFESLDIKKGWDGYYRGVLCQLDVYVWKAYIKLNNGKIFNKSGDVTLLR